MTIKNATVPPKVYYGLHFYPGVAEYREPGREPYRIFINEKTIRDMGPTFRGRPVFVHHVDEVNLDTIQEDADGYVVRSFYNEADGKHWCEFLVVSDKGHQAISNGWKLSNAYLPKSFGQGGLWNGVEYEKEVTSGEYEHLAIVNDPRYQESIILSPEQFQVYNAQKVDELKKLKNSKEESTMLNLFKKQKVENSKDYTDLVVILPKSKKEMALTQVINEMDSHYEAEIGKDPKAPAMANGDHHVKVGEEQMKVNDLISKYQAACNELAEMKKKNDGDMDESDDDSLDNADDEEAKKKALELAEHEEEEIVEKKKADKDKKENEDPAEKQAKKEEKKAHFNSLKDAPSKVKAPAPKIQQNQLERGKSRYGSGN